MGAWVMRAVAAAACLGVGGASAEEFTPPSLVADGEAYCAENFGIDIAQSVSAAGYLDLFAEPNDPCGAYCFAVLASGLFDYVEVEFDADSDPDEFGSPYVEGPGKYRFSRKPDAAPECASMAKLASAPSNSDFITIAFLIDEGKCLAVEKVEELQAAYAVDVGIAWEDVAGGSIELVTDWVIDRASDETMASNAGFSFQSDASPDDPGAAAFGFSCRRPSYTDFLAAALAGDRPNPFAAVPEDQ